MRAHTRISERWCIDVYYDNGHGKRWYRMTKPLSWEDAIAKMTPKKYNLEYVRVRKIGTQESIPGALFV